MYQCTYRRGQHRCESVTNELQTECDYHGTGGTSISRTEYFSVGHDAWMDWESVSPTKGDIKYEGGYLWLRNDTQWRKLCRICNKFSRGKSGYCRQHNPELLLLNTGTSKPACNLMDRLELDIGEKIHHVHVCDSGTVGFEFTIPNTAFKVDGFIPSKNIVIEFLGDYWHGNPNKYDPNAMNKSCKKTFGELFQNTFERLQHIKSANYAVYYIWESEWKVVKNETNVWKYLHRF